MATRYIEAAPSATIFALIVRALAGVVGIAWRTDLNAFQCVSPSGTTYTFTPTSAFSGDFTVTTAGAATLADNLVHAAEVTLTNAQVLALRATPITLVAAPGAGKKLVLVGAALNINATAGVYSETADNMAIKLNNGTGIAVSATIEATGFIDQAGKMHSQAIPIVDAIATEAQAVNVPLVLHNIGDGEYGGGNVANSLKVSVLYRIVAAI